LAAAVAGATALTTFSAAAFFSPFDAMRGWGAAAREAGTILKLRMGSSLLRRLGPPLLWGLWGYPYGGSIPISVIPPPPHRQPPHPAPTSNIRLLPRHRAWEFLRL